MKIDLAEIEQLAKAATPGDWLDVTPEVGVNLFITLRRPNGKPWPERVEGEYREFTAADWKWIAYINPQRVLALLATLRNSQLEAPRA